jgi:hypothetical protein
VTGQQPVGNDRIADALGEFCPAQPPPAGAGVLGAAQAASWDHAHGVEIDVSDGIGLDASARETRLAVLVVGSRAGPSLMLVHGIENPGRVGHRRRHEPGRAVAAQLQQPVGAAGRRERPQP